MDEVLIIFKARVGTSSWDHSHVAALFLNEVSVHRSHNSLPPECFEAKEQGLAMLIHQLLKMTS